MELVTGLSPMETAGQCTYEGTTYDNDGRVSSRCVYIVFRQYLVVREVVLVSMGCSLLAVAVTSVNTALKCRPDLLTCIINSLFILFTYVV